MLENKIYLHNRIPLSGTRYRPDYNNSWSSPVPKPLDSHSSLRAGWHARFPTFDLNVRLLSASRRLCQVFYTTREQLWILRRYSLRQMVRASIFNISQCRNILEGVTEPVKCDMLRAHFIFLRIKFSIIDLNMCFIVFSHHLFYCINFNWYS